MVTAAANAVLVVFYGLIAIEMINAIIRGRQLLSNPLLTATAAVFVTCTLGHGAHFEHATLSIAGFGGTAANVATRAEFGDLRLVFWDTFTAVVTIYFYTLRSRLAIVYRGAALCEDMAQRERQALELHDNVVQGLVRAKMELDLGNREEGRRAIGEALDASRRVITQLLGEEEAGMTLGPGDLRRTRAAGGP